MRQEYCAEVVLCLSPAQRTHAELPRTRIDSVSPGIPYRLRHGWRAAHAVAGLGIGCHLGDPKDRPNCALAIEGPDLVVARPTTGLNSAGFSGRPVDRRPTQRTRRHTLDRLEYLARVRVAGSKPIFSFSDFSGGGPLQGPKIGTDELCVAIIGWTFTDGSARAS